MKNMSTLNQSSWQAVRAWLVPPVLVPLFLAIGLGIWIAVRPALDDTLLAQPQTSDQ